MRKEETGLLGIYRVKYVIRKQYGVDARNAIKKACRRESGVLTHLNDLTWCARQVLYCAHTSSRTESQQIRGKI